MNELQMKFKTLKVAIVLLSILTNCSSDEKEIEKYNNGNVKHEVNLKEGKRHGLMQEYYPEGSIKAVSTWKDGEVHGEVVHYYEGGQLKSKGYFFNGQPTDSFISYHPNGAIHKQVTYEKGKLVGEALFYNEDGSLYEKDVYDQNGNLVYLIKFDQEGKVRDEAVIPIVHPDRDSIGIDESFTGTVTFAYPIPGEIEVFTGVLDSVNMLHDTVFMERVGNSKFKYSIAPYKRGDNVLPIVVAYTPVSPNDTLALDGSAITYPYFVE